MNAALHNNAGSLYLFFPYADGRNVKIEFRHHATLPHVAHPHRVCSVADGRAQYRKLVAEGFVRNPEIERFYADLKP